MFIKSIQHSLKYNPSLDGLRGIAVILVVLFHVYPQYFSFGYVGVDIFFVLSGYLISKIIYKKLQTNNFSFKEFYRNRIRRIFPAVIIVLLSTILVAYLFLFPIEFEILGKHIKSSAFFYQNFRLIGEVGYWDEASQLKPLLHFWSLSIEEQFYLVWPLLIFILYKFKLDIFKSLFIVFLLFLLIPQLLNIDTFYHSLSRFWELAFGGLIYASSNKYDISKYISKKIVFLIYSLFILSIYLASNVHSFNIFIILFVVISTGLLIYLLNFKQKSTILSSSVLVFIGLISFPLYLWHYMIISYVHIFGINVEENGIIIIILSLLLSYLTYRFIEFYARKQDSYKFVLLLFTILVAIGFIGKYIYKNKGFETREHLSNSKEFQKQFIRTKAKNIQGINIIQDILGYKVTNDYIKATSDDVSKKFILVTGDSHAHTSYVGFAQVFKDKGYETILLANSSCPPYLGGTMGKNIKDLGKCKDKINNIYKLIKNFKNIEKVIFITRMGYIYDIGYGLIDNGGKPWNYHFEEYFTNKDIYNQKETFFNVVENTFLNFNKKQNFYYLLENPELGFSPKTCLSRPFNIFEINCKLPYSDYIKRAGEYRQFIYKISNKYKDITLLDPKDLYCDKEYCYAIKYDKMLYADDDHHSIDGSLIQAKYFINDIFSIRQKD